MSLVRRGVAGPGMPAGSKRSEHLEVILFTHKKEVTGEIPKAQSCRGQCHAGQ